MRRPEIHALLATCLVTLLLSTSAAATTIRLHSLETLSGVADRVTHGSIVDARVERDAQGELWTVYTLLVHEELKDGSLSEGSSFSVRQFGGTLDGETVQAVGFPQFRIGEEVLLFLQPGSSGHRILNAWQGAVRVSEEPSLSGGPARKLVPSAPQLFPGTPATELESFKAELRRVLGGGAP